MDDNEAAVLINGALVRRLRKLCGDDLVTFAPKVGISHTYLSMIERGDRKRVSPAVFVRICDALGVAKRDRHTLLIGSDSAVAS